MPLTSSIKQLLDRGVHLLHPASVWIAPEINPERIAAGVTIHPGCRLSGADTAIGPDCEIGREAPVTLENCRLGRAVQLKGGYFSQSVFLDQVQIGSGAHVRPACLLEEEVGVAHSVGLKQTVLMPFVTLGSLVNFCDCLMAGGSSRKNHSEIGSAYIHFNFTPHQDKATPSLFGDVPAGVWLDQPPIFMGGQGGMVGPARVAYGTVVPAGLIVRGDIAAPGLYVPPPNNKPPPADYRTGRYNRVDRIVAANLRYIGNIIALRAWYNIVRAPFMLADQFHAACHAGALQCLDAILLERLSRMDELADKMAMSIRLHEAMPSVNGGSNESLLQQRRLQERWPTMRGQIENIMRQSRPPPSGLTEELAGLTRHSYLEAVRLLTPESRQCARAWLEAIVAAVMATY
ncbi:MAG: UDP-N-acetylglucosamine pyrophosphorylase [Kiritimatiellia bacterium]|jgi:hypothetical protein